MQTNASLCGLFGGTFDPIHRGHLAPLKETLQSAALSQIIYIPAALPPHRPPPLASAPHRLAMTRLAVADEPQFTVDEIELNQHREHGTRRASYTVDTIQALRQQNPQQRYALIVGLDALLGLETWHRWQTLQQSVHIIALARPGWQCPQTLPRWWHAAEVKSCAELQHFAAGKMLFIETTPHAISATAVRARLNAGEEVRHLITQPVWHYICVHKLYGSERYDQ